MTIGWRDGFGDWPVTPETETNDVQRSAGVDAASAHDGPRALRTEADVEDVTDEWRDGLGSWATS